MKNPIKDLISGSIFMSPMSGITDMPFRIIAQDFGCHFAFTEMVDVNGIHYRNQKTLALLNRDVDKITRGVQLVGADKEKIITAAKICEDYGFELVELNASCPVKKIIKSGKGAALLQEPINLGRIVSGLAQALKIPVTVKIRAGYSNNRLNYLETARIIASAGAAAICIHPRTRTQMYSGLPNHKITREIKAAVNIPVFASGNIFSAGDVKQVFQETNCDAVALARGILGQPWLFAQVKEFLSSGKITTTVGFETLKKLIKKHFFLCLQYIGEKRTLPRMQKHTQWYLAGFRNRNFVICQFRKVKTLEMFNKFMDNLTLMPDQSLYLTSLNWDH